MSFGVRTFNQIAEVGLARFPRDRYVVGPDVDPADAILVRSANLHDLEIPAGLKAVARAGAGVNNVPVSKLTAIGVPVFNAPGANANAVKELVLAGMLMAARNLPAALTFTRGLEGDEVEMNAQAEAGKKAYLGFELPRRTLGVVGLGAIGVEVCNAAQALGMNVVGFDPQLTVQRAWQLSSSVRQALSLDDLLAQVDFVTFHVPLNEHTRGMLSAERVRRLKRGATVLNLARGGIVDDEAVVAALDANRLHAYVTDFPAPALVRHPRVVVLPHLGASTGEAEENCAVQVADTLRDFLEHGIVRHSVNFPDAVLPPVTDGWRLLVANRNVPNMIGQITTILARANLNIVDMLNQSRGDTAWNMLDLDQEVPAAIVTELANVAGILSARVIAPKENAA